MSLDEIESFLSRSIWRIRRKWAAARFISDWHDKHLCNGALTSHLAGLHEQQLRPSLCVLLCRLIYVGLDHTHSGGRKQTIALLPDYIPHHAAVTRALANYFDERRRTCYSDLRIL